MLGQGALVLSASRRSTSGFDDLVHLASRAGEDVPAIRHDVNLSVVVFTEGRDVSAKGTFRCALDFHWRPVPFAICPRGCQQDTIGFDPVARPISENILALQFGYRLS